MYVHVCISMQSVSASIACIGPLGHGNHHSIPKTPPRDPAPGGTHSGHPRACARPLFDPIPTSPSDPIFRFFLQESVLGPVLPWPWNPPGCSGQAKTLPNRPPTSIVQDPLVCAEIRYFFLPGECIKDAPLHHFCDLVHLATVVESARIVQAGSNLDHSSSHPHCARRTRAR